MGTYACLLLDDTLHGVSASRRSHLDILDLDFLGLVGLDFLACYVHLAEHGGIGMEHNLQGLLAAWASQNSRLRLVSNHGEFNCHAVCRVQPHAELSLQGGESHLSLAQYRDGNEFHRVVVIVHDSTLQRKFLCHHLQGGNQAYCKNDDSLFHTLLNAETGDLL